MRATSVATRPRILPPASTTYHLCSISPAVTEYVFIVLSARPGRGCRPGAGDECSDKKPAPGTGPGRSGVVGTDRNVSQTGHSCQPGARCIDTCHAGVRRRGDVGSPVGVIRVSLRRRLVSRGGRGGAEYAKEVADEPYRGC